MINRDEKKAFTAANSFSSKTTLGVILDTTFNFSAAFLKMLCVIGISSYCQKKHSKKFFINAIAKVLFFCHNVCFPLSVLAFIWVVVELFEKCFQNIFQFRYNIICVIYKERECCYLYSQQSLCHSLC